jgi:2,3-bisphosphoglycerate-independent phosphoglycerate mutase
MSSVSGVPRKPVVLVILDGVGVNPCKTNNGFSEAMTPKLDACFNRYPHTTLNASGYAVGLPDGQMGNSEVGHLTLGAGAIIRQDSVCISDAISNDQFFSNTAFVQAVNRAKQKQRPVHLLGLVSDGGVHSQIDHLMALIEICRQANVSPMLHMITDGRDTLPSSALNYLPELETELHEAGGAIASIMGRFYAMDRDNRWERTEIAWRALTMSSGESGRCAESAIRSAYHAGDTDEFIRPILLPTFESIQENDEVIFFNFRKDRPRQLVSALADEGFAGFDRGNTGLANMTCMMPYESSYAYPYAFEPERPEITVSEIISEAGLNQLHCAETEKYAHVTYFFNGGHAGKYEGEEQILIPSPKVATYDLKPSMSAQEVADTVVSALNNKEFAFIVVNFANGDMVGHTAKKHAILEAVETLDSEVSRVIHSAENNGYSVIVTADHGNCEEIIDPYTGEPNTQHTTYPVPCLIVDEDNWQLSSAGGLSNVAPTILELMGLPIPEEMSAGSLLLRKLPGERRKDFYQPDILLGVA